MGKIKSRLVKRTAENLMEEGVEFEQDFEKNKKILKNDLPSKKIRNQLAGYLARIKKKNKTQLNK